MKALLQLQWSLHKSTLLFFIIGIGIIAYFFHDAESEMSLVTFALVFSMSSISNRIFTSQNTQYVLYSMPISQQTLIKSLYVTNFVICTVIFSLILPIQIYSGLVYDSLNAYIITLTGFYGGCLIGMAFHLSFQLQNIDNDSSLESFLSCITGMMLISLPHMAITSISHEPTFWLRLLVMPAISLILYVYLMHRGIKKFSDRELI